MKPEQPLWDARYEKTTPNAPVRVEGRTEAGGYLRRSGDEPAGDECTGNCGGEGGPVRSGGQKLSFVHSSPEVAGTVDSTVCTLRLNKAGKEVGGEGEDAARRRKLS